jgi:hypothetical protein
LFLRLLDARIASATVRAVLALVGGTYPTEAARVKLRPRHDDARAATAADRLGGLTGDGIIAASQIVETEIVDLLDSLLPVDWSTTTRGHAELYSLRLLSDSDVFVDGEILEAQPLLLLDDGHELTVEQRKALITALLDRDITVARWYAERFEALSVEELLQDDTAGRDYEPLELERAARDTATSGRRRFDRLLREVGNLRAGWHLERYTHGARDFFEYLDDPGSDLSMAAVDDIRDAAAATADGNSLYEKWIDQADTGPLYERAIRLRSAQILIERYLRRPQQALFDVPEGADFDALLKSDIKEAARLFLSREHDLAYYAGENIVVSVASQNIEQFLRVCGDLFEYMLGQITLNEVPAIRPGRQQIIIRRASERFWRELPARLPNAPDVIQILQRITAIALTETARPTAPYAPGVNGIATPIYAPGSREPTDSTKL